jgi:Flp pilus assembly protein TadB
MTKRLLLRILGVGAPVVALVIVLVVLHGAGVPLSLPGVIVVFVILVIARMVVRSGRRRRTDRG